MMYRGTEIGLIVLLVFQVLLPIPQVCATESHYTVDVGLTIEEIYDDNIFLRPNDEVSDLISTITPTISLDAMSPKKGIDLDCQIGFVVYGRNSDYNTVRHAAGIDAFYRFGQYSRLDFADTFYRTEEPREPSEATVITRRTRNVYYRNAGNIQFSHQFGEQNRFYTGYNDVYLDNGDPEIEDSRIASPFVGLDYGISAKNRIEADLRYSVGDYEQTPDFKQLRETVRLVRSSSGKKRLVGSYSHSSLDYDTGRRDYSIDDVNLLYSTGSSAHLQLTAGIGYFTYNPEEGNNTDGISYQAAVDKTLERGSVSLSGQGGYRQELIEAENLGFAKFWSFDGSAGYFLSPALTASAGAGYFEEEFIEQQLDRRDKLWSASAGLDYSYRSWFTVGLSGQHAELDSNVNLYDYTDNRIVLRIGAIYNLK